MDKIICVGKNYLDHARELGDAVPEDPVYFLKPPSVLRAVKDGEVVSFPAHFELHHELELVLRLTKRDRSWGFSHYTFGLDLTLRDLQTQLKQRGQPWEKAKVFKNSAIIGPLFEINDGTSLDRILATPFTLEVNGEVRQRGVGRDMRWTPTELLADLGRWFPLSDGDLIFTGTPAGVGPLFAKDQLVVRGGDVSFSLTVLRENT